MVGVYIIESQVSGTPNGSTGLTNYWKRNKDCTLFMWSLHGLNMLGLVLDVEG